MCPRIKNQNILGATSPKPHRDTSKGGNCM
jgi:hypothetical protein